MTIAATGSTAALSLQNRQPTGGWHEILRSPCYIGKNGLGKTREGDQKTPVGIFRFTTAFGIRPNPGTMLPYIQVNDSHYWVDDGNSAYYNQFVSTDTVEKDWHSAEHLTGIGSAYNYALALSYNPKCTPGLGSAVFLHCSTGSATSGCIAVPERCMEKILQNVLPDCPVIIGSADPHSNSGVEKYLSAVSGSTVTTVFPFPSFFASFIAAATFVPLDIPHIMPSLDAKSLEV